MKRIVPISMLALMAVLLFPWQVLCMAHPLGHDHHDDGHPTPCEMRKLFDGENILPPMHCFQISLDAADFLPDHDAVTVPVVTVPMLAVAAAVLTALPPAPCVRPLFPDPGGGETAALAPVLALRGPPAI